MQVKCQAHGTSTRAVLRELRGLGSKRAGMALLYKGLGPSVVAAALIGAAYLSSFHLFKWVLPAVNLLDVEHVHIWVVARF